MKPLSRLESLIAEIMERPAWALSSHRLHPLALTAALTKALEARAVRLADRVLAPDVYEIRISPADLRAFGDAQPILERELGEYLLRTITERDISSNRPPSVRLVSDAALRAGRTQVTARFTPDSNSDSAYSGRNGSQRPVSPATYSLQIIGADGSAVRACDLLRLPLTIGRRSDAGLPLMDSKVSRDHARIDKDATGAFTVSDLQSLNGTLVNGEQIRGPRRLRHTDELEIGRFRLRFVADSG